MIDIEPSNKLSGFERTVLCLLLAGTGVFALKSEVVNSEGPLLIAQSNRLALSRSCNVSDRFEGFLNNDGFISVDHLNDESNLSLLLIKNGPPPERISAHTVHQAPAAPGIVDLDVSLTTTELQTGIVSTDSISAKSYCPTQTLASLLGWISNGLVVMTKSG